MTKVDFLIKTTTQAPYVNQKQRSPTDVCISTQTFANVAIKMYDSASGIEAYIRPYGSTAQYQEYEALPSSPLFTGSPRERYIEAVTDERYEMVVVLHKSFDFMGKPETRMDIDIDGGTRSLVGDVAREDWEEDRYYEDITSSDSDIIDGKWRNVGFAFGAVSAADDNDLTEEQEQQETSMRGKITISIYRGCTTGQDREITTGYGEKNRPLRLQSSKRVAVDNAKSHSFKSVIDDDEEEPETPVQAAKFKAARGKAGKPIEFTFFYASRMILELKKVIPGSSTTAALPFPGFTPDPKLLSSKPPTLNLEDAVDSLHQVNGDGGDGGFMPKDNIKTELGVADDNVADRSGPAEASVQIKTESVEATERTGTNHRHAAEGACGGGPSAQRKHASSKDSIIILDDSDDEEGPPPKKSKIGAIMPRPPLATPTSETRSSVGMEADPGFKIKRELQDTGFNGTINGSNANGFIGGGSKLTKGKERARLELELEAIRIRQEEIKIRQRLMEFDE